MKAKSQASSGRSSAGAGGRLLAVLIGCCCAVVGCNSRPEGSPVKLGRHTLRLPENATVSSAYDDPGSEELVITLVSLKANSRGGGACNPDRAGYGYRVHLTLLPQGATLVVPERPMNGPPVDPRFVKYATPLSKLDPKQSRAISSLENRSGGSVVQTLGSGWPLLQCSKDCRVVFRVDDVIVDASCGDYDPHFEQSAKDIQDFSSGLDGAIRGWMAG